MLAGDPVTQRLRAALPQFADQSQLGHGVGHHPLGRVGGGGRAQVGDQIAQRVVRLVAHGAHHRRGAGRDRPAQRLVGERQQVLDAAAAAGEHDDVHLRVAVQLAQRLDDLRHRVGALHGGVADREPHRRPPLRGHRGHVVFGGAGPPGDQADGRRQERQRPFEPRVEQPLGLEQTAQPFDAGQQLAHADGANLAEPQRE